MFVQRVACATLSSPLQLLFSAAALGTASVNICHFAKTADLVNLSAAVERDDPAEAERLAKSAAEPSREGASADCGDAVSRARLTVSLAALRSVDSATTPAQVAPTLGHAISASQARLECSPVDGNAWLQWATLQLRAAGPTSAVMDAVGNSTLFAPAEAWIVTPRLDLETAIDQGKPGALGPAYDDDLRLFVTFEAVSQVAAAYVGHADAVRRRMRMLFQALPTTRRGDIATEIDRLGVDFSKP